MKMNMHENRPDFNELKTFDEFKKYYWYREELSQICKSLGLEYRGTKNELNEILEQFFKGNRMEPSSRKRPKKISCGFDLDSPLLQCGFSFNQVFRDYFSVVTGVSKFKFTADMAAAWRKVKQENNVDFTIRDLLKIYYGESDYARYDRSACQWNRFLKDFCSDERSNTYSNKLKVAAILWTIVRKSDREKIYSDELLNQYEDQVEMYRCK